MYKFNNKICRRCCSTQSLHAGEKVHLVVLEVHGRADGIEEDPIGTPAELVAQGVVRALGGGETSTEGGVGLHLEYRHRQKHKGWVDVYRPFLASENR